MGEGGIVNPHETMWRNDILQAVGKNRNSVYVKTWMFLSQPQKAYNKHTYRITNT